MPLCGPLATAALAALAASDQLPSFGGLLLKTIASLALVCLLAVVVVRFGLARWLKGQQPDPAHLALVASLPLGPRRSVHLVRALDRLIVVGASEAGLQHLADLGPGAAQGLMAAQESAAAGLEGEGDTEGRAPEAGAAEAGEDVQGARLRNDEAPTP